jgi:hypothetical protein
MPLDLHKAFLSPASILKSDGATTPELKYLRARGSQFPIWLSIDEGQVV